MGYAGWPRGCSGAGAAPPALGKGEEKVAKGRQIGSGGRGPLQHRNFSQIRPGRDRKGMSDNPMYIARRAEGRVTSSAGLRAATKTQQCGSVLSEPIYSVPLPSLCATFPRPGSLLQVMLGVWATPAGRVAAAVPAQPPQHWVTGRGREWGPFAGFGGQRRQRGRCSIVIIAGEGPEGCWE